MDAHTRTPTPPNTYKQIQINDATLHYLESGTKSKTTPTIVLSHPHLTDIRTWKTLQPFLASHFHVLSYSRRYFWPNTPISPTDHDDWHQHTADLATLITTLNLAPVHVLGNSSGAVIALMLAQSHPDLVSSLILEEPPLPYIFLPTLPPSPLSVLKLLITHPTAFLPMLSFGINTIDPTTKLCKETPPRRLDALEIFAPGACSTPTWNRIKSDPEGQRLGEVLDNLDVTVNVFRYDDFPCITAEDLSKLKMPVLMVTGGETVGGAEVYWVEGGDVCVGSAVKKEVVVEGAGHFVHEDAVRRVGEEVVKWVGGVEERIGKGEGGGL